MPYESVIVDFRAIYISRVNGMFYDYLVLYSDYRADIWYYLAHLHTQKNRYFGNFLG